MFAIRLPRVLVVALSTMFMQQTFASIGKILPPVIAPAIMADLNLDPAWLGPYIGISAAAALTFQLGCGSFILRYGALRMSQVALLLLAFGLAISASGWISLLILSAIIGGGGVAMSTPASSHLLGRFSPPRYAPLVFSIKQTAVPAGLLVSGLVGPWLTGLTGWRGTFLIIAAACAAFAFMLQPLQREFDADRNPAHAFHFSDFITTLAAVTGKGDLRTLSMGCFAFNGVQTVFTSYFVVYLVHIGYELAAAGFIFSLAMLLAVPGRIFWGWLGSGIVSPRKLMAWLSLGMAVSAVCLGLYGPGWGVLLLGLCAVGLSATAMSWHGVLLAEAARLAPPGMRGAATGGVLSFGQVGALVLPMLYGGLLGATGSHGIGFIVCGVPAFAVGLALLRQERGTPDQADAGAR